MPFTGDRQVKINQEEADATSIATSIAADMAADKAADHLVSGSESLYTPEQKRRRDASVWTLVQGILAPLQFLVFLVSVGFVLRYLQTGLGFEIAAWSVVLKTVVLLSIMVTGSLWEHDVFGRYLFVPAFFWEDVVSMGVIALHLAYVTMFVFGFGTATEQMLVALMAYAAYVVNAIQFVWKFRLARLSSREVDTQGDFTSKFTGQIAERAL